VSAEDPARPAPRPRYPEYPGERPVEPPAQDRTGEPTTSEARPDPQPVAAGADVPAGWWIRALAALLDGFVVLAVAVVPVVVGLVLAFDDAGYDEATEEVTGVDPTGLVLVGVGLLLWLLVDLWNRGLRVGYRGQSIGKQMVGVHVVGRRGTPVGALEGFFRWLLGGLLQWTLVGFLLDLLWPVFDGRGQTLHDKAIGTFPVRRA
jgi:uncharacterized RDD family membrane protein YckC